MNKTLIIIICDFLLLSMLSMARFDKPELQIHQEKDTPSQSVAGDANPEGDLLEVLKSSLEEEEKARAAMSQQLTEAQQALQNREAQMTEQERKWLQAQNDIRTKDEEAVRLAQARAALERQLQTNQSRLTQLQQEHSKSETDLAALQRQATKTQAELEQMERLKQASEQELQQVKTQQDASRTQIDTLKKEVEKAQSESRVNQQLVDALQQDLQKRVQELGQMEGKVQTLDQARQAAVLEGQKLSGQLQVAQTEVRLTSEQLKTTQKEIGVVREEKAVMQKQTTELTKGVNTLATQSDQLTKEIRQSRPLTPNNIFNQFSSNRIHSSFQAARTGVFGQTVRKDSVANTILFSKGNQIYAVYHVGETPFELAAVPTEWSSMFGTFRHQSLFSPMTQVSFLDRDPRIMISQVTAEQAQKLGCQIYSVSEEAFKFQDAVLVGATDNYYGECRFQIDPETPGYMRMEREFLGRIFGKFVPSRGDMVFAKTGELIGMMANKEYCLVFDKLTASRTIRLGQDLSGQYITALLSQMYYQLAGLPFRLQ